MQAGLKHVVFSTMEDPRPFIDPSIPDLSHEPGRKVAHLEVKEEVQVTRSSLGHNKPCTPVLFLNTLLTSSCTLAANMAAS